MKYNEKTFENLFGIELCLTDMESSNIEADNDFEMTMREEIEWCYLTEEIIKSYKHQDLDICLSEKGNILVFDPNKNICGGVFECSLWIEQSIRGRGIGKYIVGEYIKENGHFNAISFTRNGLITCLKAYLDLTKEASTINKEVINSRDRVESLLSHLELRNLVHNF